ncbi:SLC13 family permease [Neolewinella litorea]|uniref:SLC13/DASS family transporter n=1 Tax=Neolewinella litorea TaxID=2562452 RepID=A0A4S4NNN7_9BACT|nr:SLC13 family permease [Neolewinella litorea]THH41619.1 SLC13/DASS family transporter [Neolewinella litorea]
MNTRTLGLFLGPLLFIACQLFLRPEGLPPAGTAVLATTVWMAVWWVTEAVPIAVTALLPIVLFPLSGAADLDVTTAGYGHRYVFLFLGGFLIAMAIEKWNLHRRIALGVIALIGSNVRMIILGAMAATALLSMWISNTATAVMMLPIATAIAAHLGDDPSTQVNENQQFGKALMLAVAYSASIGGMATLIGTPVNLVFAGVVREAFGVEISFARWFMLGFPIAVILLLMCWWYLTRVAFRFEQRAFRGGREEVRRQLAALGPMSAEEKKVLAVFSVTALAWIFRTSVLERFLPGFDDPIIAIIGGIALFLVPGPGGDDRALLEWSEAVKLPWGIILLLGSGFALAAGFGVSGLAEYIGASLRIPEGVGLLVVVLAVTAAVNFMTEITSNVATTSMLMPVLAAAALPLGVHPFTLMVPACLAGTCAFMLPVATPPNAVVFGSGYLTIPDMVRAGLWLNLISILVIALVCYFALPWLWEFNATSLPTWIGGAAE